MSSHAQKHRKSAIAKSVTKSGQVSNTQAVSQSAADFNEDITQKRQEKMKFGIDIGHNCSSDTGAVGFKKEDDLTKAVGTKLMEKLSAAGHSVINCTPNTAASLDDSLQKRVYKANTNMVDIFVSIHFNAAERTDKNLPMGTEIYAISNVSRAIAKTVLAEIVKLGFKNRGIKHTPWFVIKNTSMPAILVECCFCDSKADMDLVDAEKMAEAIKVGLIGDSDDTDDTLIRQPGILQISKTTVLKPSTAQAAELTPEDLINIDPGNFPVLDFRYEERHYWVKWKDKSKGNRDEHFVFDEHGKVVETDNQTVENKMEAVEETPTVLKPIAINLTKAVGRGVVNNNPGEVKAVKQRLRDLGYTWVGNPDSATIDTGTVEAIKLFQSIIAGRSTVTSDGRIDVGQFTHQWLQAANAPRWVAMPESNPAIGFVNYEREDTNDNHDFGTHWLADTILAIAKDYQSNYRNSHTDAAPFVINNVSMPLGGETPAHSGHETGLMCDVLLPRKGGRYGGIEWSDAIYDRSAARALLQSIQKQKLVRLVLFNDTTLRGENLCTYSDGHNNHIHFEIDPPVRT